MKDFISKKFKLVKSCDIEDEYSNNIRTSFRYIDRMWQAFFGLLSPVKMKEQLIIAEQVRPQNTITGRGGGSIKTKKVSND